MSRVRQAISLVLCAVAVGGCASEPAPAAAPPSPAGERYFPAAAWMYQQVSAAPVHPDSANVTRWLEEPGRFPWGGWTQIDFSIEVLEAPSDAPLLPFQKTGAFFLPDCDDAPVPVPRGGALEGESGYACTSGGDCHLIVVQRSAGRLYEMWKADLSGGVFSGGCLAVWDLGRVYAADGRGEQCTSADAAGFPIAPLLLAPEEVAAAASGGAEIDHAIRFVLPNDRIRASVYVHPATHAGAPSAADPSAPPYGSRWRLKAGFDMTRLPNAAARAVARALQRHGMALADGGDLTFTFRSDRFTPVKWAGLLGPRDLAALRPTDFEILDTGPTVALTYDCVRAP